MQDFNCPLKVYVGISLTAIVALVGLCAKSTEGTKATNSSSKLTNANISKPEKLYLSVLEKPI